MIEDEAVEEEEAEVRGGEVEADIEVASAMMAILPSPNSSRNGLPKQTSLPCPALRKRTPSEQIHPVPSPPRSVGIQEVCDPPAAKAGEVGPSKSSLRARARNEKAHHRRLENMVRASIRLSSQAFERTSLVDMTFVVPRHWVSGNSASSSLGCKYCSNA